MKGIRFVHLVLIASSFAFASCMAGSFSDADYKTRTHGNYETAQFRQRIDFGSLNTDLLNAAIFFETSKARVRVGLKPLEYSADLARAAQAHTDDMVRNNFFSHQGSTPATSTVEKRLKRAGVQNVFGSENVAWSYGLEFNPQREVFSPAQNGGYWSYTYKGKPLPPHTYSGLARAVVKYWMNSPADQGNITNTAFSKLGVATAQYERADRPAMPFVKVTGVFAGGSWGEK